MSRSSGPTFQKLPVVVLAGGLGTRVRHLLPENMPKPMADAAGRPFIDWLVRFLSAQGLRSVTISTGYRADVIASYFEGHPVDSVEIRCLEESEPMGTAGGFVNAIAGREEEPSWLVCNGDSMIITDLSPLWQMAANADAALLALEVPDCSRYGSLTLDAVGRLTAFSEKRPGPGLINAGVYILSKRMLPLFPRRLPLSFELDVFPTLLAVGATIAVHSTQAPFLDIGTEQTLSLAGEFIRQHSEYFS